MVSYRVFPLIMSRPTNRHGPARGRSADAGLPGLPARSNAAARAWTGFRARIGAWGAVLALAAAGCETEYSYREKQQKEKDRYALRDPAVLVVTHQVGGAHHRGIVIDGVWYVSYGPSVLAVSADTGTVLGAVEARPRGSSGAVRELIAVRRDGSLRLFACLPPTDVVELEVVDRINLSVAGRTRAKEIGFVPRGVSLVGDEVWINGDRGAVRLDDVPLPIARPAVDDERTASSRIEPPLSPRPALREAIVERGAAGCGPVVATASGLASTVGRRVLAIDDGSFLGAATRLEPVDPVEAARAGVPDDSLLFILQGEGASSIGIMGPDVRELASGAISGTVRQVRLLNGRLFAINDTEMLAFPVLKGEGGAISLGDPTFIRVRGARDIARIGDNLYAVCGSFGRAFYRLEADATGAADEFFRAEREPSGLIHAVTDRRRVLAGGPEGSWLYTIGGEVALVNQPVPIDDARSSSASTGWCDAKVSDDRSSVTLTRKGLAEEEEAVPPLAWTPPAGGPVHAIESIDNRIWALHDAGIQVFGLDRSGAIDPDGAFFTDGPVRFLFPQRLGGAATFVSEWGGFGVLDFVEREALPDVAGTRLLDLDGDGDDDDLTLTPAQLAGPEVGKAADRISLPTGNEPAAR
jgi:hypothetical protein